VPTKAAEARVAVLPHKPTTKGVSMMKAASRALLGTVFAFGLAAAPLVHADVTPGANVFQKMLDMNKDGMVSKSEAMETFAKMFDKADTSKKGMLTKEQAENLYKMLTQESLGS
jgi:hypothetical protein